ncbi:MAG: TetR/AcrR family transcriptional regulator [Limnobacter sp.]|nr:TetR/AcrR family transcriptional regulator [Limnobacter sp.]
MKSAAHLSTPPKWERRKQDRPQELLQAALHVFGSKGFAAARLDDVAKRAGVSKGTVYLYYSNKEELLKEVVRQNVSPIVDSVKDAQSLCDQAHSADLITDAINQWWTRYGSTDLNAITKLILSEATSFPELGRFFYEEVIHPWWDYLESILQRGIDRGEFPPLDTEYTAKVLCSPLVTLGIWKRSMDLCCNLDTDPARYIQAYTRMILNGLDLRQTNEPSPSRTQT